MPHEHRRELRALKVFGAWTNLVDMKAGNTLDTLITDERPQRRAPLPAGRRLDVRHRRQRAARYDEGWEYLYRRRARAEAALVTLGFFICSPGRRCDYVENPAIGRFEGNVFDPPTWKPRVPTAAFLRARPDDNFWAARRVAGVLRRDDPRHRRDRRLPDPAARKLLADVLIQRRDKIGRRTCRRSTRSSTSRSPPTAAVVRQCRGATGWRRRRRPADASPGPASTTPPAPLPKWGHQPQRPRRATLPSPLPSDDGTYLKVDIRAVQPPYASWAQPASAFFRRIGGAWKLVGLERMN